MKTEYQEPSMEVLLFGKTPRTLIVESIGSGEDIETCREDDEIF